MIHFYKGKLPYTWRLRLESGRSVMVNGKEFLTFTCGNKYLRPIRAGSMENESPRCPEQVDA